MATTPQNAARACLFVPAFLLLIALPCLFTLAAACPAAAVAAAPAPVSKHLWPLAAIHFDEPSPETVTFNMADDEFWSRRAALERRITRAYDELMVHLPHEQQALLGASQSSWRYYVDRAEQALKGRLDEPVKVFYGVEGKERKTNVYKDTILAILEYRVIDLESWQSGGWALPPGDALGVAAGDLQVQLVQALSLVDDAFGMNVYIMDEVFRLPAREAQSAWYAWLSCDARLVRAVAGAAAGNDEAVPATAVAASQLLQVQRMYELTLLQKEGWVFFHRERED